MHRFDAIAAPGLEPIVARELESRGFRTQLRPGVVEFEGALVDASLAAELRTPARLLLVLDHGPARSYEELAVRVRKIDWRPFLVPGSNIEVSANCRKSKLRFRDAVEKKIRLAIQDAVRGIRSGKTASKPVPYRNSGTEPGTQRISARIDADVLTLSIDCGGELLHRRGWRTRSVRAPLRENLAASLLWAAGWEGDEPLVDPFCGSGTIPIEAARMTARFSPGTTRRYAFESWPNLKNPGGASTAERGLWKPEHRIVGADRDGQSLLIAEENARRAGVRLDWIHSDIGTLEPPAPYGLLVANPPYGKRLGNRVQSVYSTFGRTLRERFRGWRAIFLAPEDGLARRVDRGAECLTQFSNGGIRVGIWVVE